jgi:ribosome-associated protein
LAVIEIAPGIGVSEYELTFSFDRSPGPGGQNANKTSTRVTLHFDVNKSMSLSTAQKAQVRKALASRINQDGVLRIISSKERTQLANRRAAVNRFIELMTKAFRTPKTRKKTKVPASAQQKRLDTKTRRGTVKRLRQAKVSAGGD